GMIVGPLVTIVWYFWSPIDIYEGGPAFLSALLAIVIVSLFTQPPKGDRFEEMWDTYTEKNEVGTPAFLPSDLDAIEKMKSTNLNLKTEKEIVTDLLNTNDKGLSSFVLKKG